MERLDDELQDLARSALAIPGIESATIFMSPPQSGDLRLVAAAGIDGEPLSRLSTAVLNPAHPIARTLRDATPAFDVRPTAPVGPALRSHLPIFVDRDGQRVSAGVLAVAHDPVLDERARAALRDLAGRVSNIA